LIDRYADGTCQFINGDRMDQLCCCAHFFFDFLS
jgi:hypothetical protein